jgi:hypothetical protein
MGAMLGRVAMVVPVKGDAISRSRDKTGATAKDQADGEQSERAGHISLLAKENPAGRVRRGI